MCGLPGGANDSIGPAPPRATREVRLLLGSLWLACPAATPVVSPQASSEMNGVLKREQSPEGIGRQRPGCATKAGALDRLRSDVGIVYGPSGRVALAITVDEIDEVVWTVDNPALLAISALADALVEALAPPRP